eukprot:4030042-Lingulodinium_polyedra.AAC.1
MERIVNNPKMNNIVRFTNALTDSFTMMQENFAKLVIPGDPIPAVSNRQTAQVEELVKEGKLMLG